MRGRYDVNVQVFLEVIDQIAAGQETRLMVTRKTEAAAQSLRAGAPVRTGAARASISSTVDRDFEAGWVGKATWDDEHYYIGILNSRTHWAAGAVQRIRYV